MTQTMSDLEMVRACAEAMGYVAGEPWENGLGHTGICIHKPDDPSAWAGYDPLHDDAQEAGKFLASERERLIGEARDAQEREKAAESRCAELQAKIDALMLEYCPQEMTQEQVDNWMAAQARVSPEDEARINAALAKEAKHE